MIRAALRLTLLALAFALGTYVAGWWAVPVVGVIWGVINPSGRRVAIRAGVAAAVGWLLLLVIPAVMGAPTASFAARLASAMELPTWLLIAAEFAFPFALGWSAAALGALAGWPASARDSASVAR
ncbi:MAG TPA: hypothetical protein VIJ16_04345 [Gemmatimonadaceae bacterium]